MKTIEITALGVVTADGHDTGISVMQSDRFTAVFRRWIPKNLYPAWPHGQQYLLLRMPHKRYLLDTKNGTDLHPGYADLVTDVAPHVTTQLQTRAI